MKTKYDRMCLAIAAGFLVAATSGLSTVPLVIFAVIMGVWANNGE